MRLTLPVALRSEDSRKPASNCGQRCQPSGIAQQLLFLLTIPLLLTARTAFAAAPVQIKIRDLASVEGVRENPLIGYGMIVGLNGTGDKQQTIFAVQTLAGMLQRMGVLISPAAVRVKNIASVFVTANLPPFARPGTVVDVT